MKKSHRSIADADSVKIIDSPVGQLVLAATEAGLTHILFVDGTERWNSSPVEHTAGDAAVAILEETERQLGLYFAGNMEYFDIPLAPTGTEFQHLVWNGLVKIAYGKTISYGELAERIGKPSAVRAVGAANGANPIPIIVPCHRVIGSDGSLTGFGGGIGNKMHLLTLEGVRLGKNGGATLF